MPPQPPVRPDDSAYHFHVYDYARSDAPGKGPFKESPAQPDRYGWTFYSLVRDLHGLEAAGRANGVPNISVSSALAAIPAAGPMYTMQLSFGNNAPNTPTVVITGGIHAREWIAPEFVYLLAEYLVMHYTDAPQDDYQRAIRDLVNERRIRIIPMLNPAGNYRTVFGGAGTRLWRKNLAELPDSAAKWLNRLAPTGIPNPPFTKVEKGWLGWAQYDVPDYPAANPERYRTRGLSNGKIGVDLNRNFATTAFGHDCAPDRDDYDPGSDSYFGPRAGSEPETDNVVKFLYGTAPVATAIDYHSYGRLILYPTETYDANAVDPGYRRLGLSLHQLVVSESGQQYRIGTPWDLTGYDATGTVDDYIAQRYQARAFTIELDPAGDDPGFILPQTQIRTVFETNICGALGAIAAPLPSATQEDLDNAVRQFLSWYVYGRGNQLPE